MYQQNATTGRGAVRLRGGVTRAWRVLVPALLACALWAAPTWAEPETRDAVYRVGEAGGPSEPRSDVVDALLGDRRFDTFVLALQTAGLTDLLRGPGPFVLEAPTDDAFARLPDGELDRLLADRERLYRTLARHVAMGNKTLPEVVFPSTRRVATPVSAEQILDSDGAIRADNGVIRAFSAVRLAE